MVWHGFYKCKVRLKVIGNGNFTNRRPSGRKTDALGEAISSEEVLKESSGVYQLTAEYGEFIGKMIGEINSDSANTGTLHMDYVSALLNFMLITMVREIPVCGRPEKQLRISRVIHYIRKHYREEITLQDLADYFYVSPYYLCREFKRYTNSTITQYINTVRAMNAEIELLTTEKKITEIAIGNGFSGNTHFYRVFRAYAGEYPSEYRKRRKKAPTPMLQASKPVLPVHLQGLEPWTP